jgi:hypothetical protein
VFLKTWIVSLSLILTSQVWAASTYPTIPDDNLTPGSLCKRGSSRRYPERIPYCERGVSKGEKWEVIAAYNEIGFRIERKDRQQFKIDHLIPLCAGGSNEPSNLWPQHRTVYDITDPLEGLACEKMAKGRLRQARAVELLLYAKHHLDEVPQVLALLQSL